MAIAYGSTGTLLNVSVAATTWNVAYPSGIAAGDLLVLHIVTNGGVLSSTPPTGWTEIYRETVVSNPKGGVYIKVASGSESGTVSVAVASTTGVAGMVRYTGVDTGTPLDATSGTVSLNTTGDLTVSLPSITTVTNGAMVLMMGAANSTSKQWTGPGGTEVERIDFTQSLGTSKSGSLWEEARPTAGATGTRDLTMTSPGVAHWGVILALRPVASNVHTEQITTFEDGTATPWTSSLAGAGTVAVRTADEHDGQYGASADVPAATVDKAGFTQTVTPAQQMTISGWWKVTTEGASSGSNVPFARIFSGSQRLADVYRQNQQAPGAANVWLRVVKAAGGSNYWFISTGYELVLNTWVYISFTWGLDGNPYVFINGTQVLGPANKPADWFAASSIDTAYLGTHEAGNQGAWSADTITLSTNSIAQTIVKPLASEGLFSGSGTLTKSVVPNPIVTVNFSSSGSLTSTRTITASASGSLSGSGTLSSTRTMTASASALYSGTGTLSSTRTMGATQSGSLSGSGTLTSSSVAGANRSASLSGSGTLSSSVTAAASATGTLSSDGLLDGDQTAAAMVASVPLSGTGTLSKAVVAGFAAGMSSSSTGTLTTATNGMSAQAAFLGTSSGTLTGSAAPAVSKTVAFSSTGTLSSTRTPGVSITAPLSGVGDLTAASSNSFTRTAPLSGSGTLSGVIAGMSLSSSAALSSVGTLNGGTVNNKSVSVNLSGSGAFAPFLTSVGFPKSVGLSGSGTLSGSAVINRTANPALSGSGTLSAVVKPSFMVDFVQIGSSLLTVDMHLGMNADAQLVSVGTLTGDPDDQLNYDVTAYLAKKRWSGTLGSQRWKGSL